MVMRNQVWVSKSEKIICSGGWWLVDLCVHADDDRADLYITNTKRG